MLTREKCLCACDTKNIPVSGACVCAWRAISATLKNFGGNQMIQSRDMLTILHIRLPRGAIRNPQIPDWSPILATKLPRQEIRSSSHVWVSNITLYETSQLLPNIANLFLFYTSTFQITKQHCSYTVTISQASQTQTTRFRQALVANI